MISAHPSVLLTQQSNQTVNLFNLATSPRSVPFEAKGSGWDFSGAQADASTLSRGTITFQELINLDQGPPLSNASTYSIPVEPVDLGVALCMESHQAAHSGLHALLGMCDTNPQFPSIEPVQDGGRWISLATAGDPVMGGVLQTNDEIPGYFISSAVDSAPDSYTIHPDPRIPYTDQHMRGNFKTAGSYIVSSVNNPYECRESGPPAARSSTGDHSYNLTDPAAMSDSSLYLGEASQVLDFEQFIASEGPACLCEWQDENGVICGGIVTHANLPGHLSAHGIKNMRRDRLTKCKWAGCTKKPMNRESIARHVREVHMHLKRTPKREQESRL